MSKSPVTRRYRRYRMQHAASFAIADALKNAPDILTPARTRRLKVLARRIETCAITTIIKLETPPGDATRIVYRNKRRCRNGLCMPCARIRAREANQRIGKRLDTILADNPSSRFAFLTLTSRNQPITEVAAMFKAHEQALSRFWRNAAIARATTGHVTGLEIALRGTGSNWQAGVHSHSLVALHPDYFDRKANRYLSQRRLVALWRRALRTDYNPICHITAVPAGGDVKRNLRECVKYAVAPHKLFQSGNGYSVDPLVATLLADTLYKRRLVRSGGVFAGRQRAKKSKAKPPHPTQPEKETS